MAKARKDNRGYALRTGEYQRSDGRYAFAYTNLKGERHTIYEKTLADLRAREKKILREIEDGLDPRAAERITLNELYDKYIGQKYDLKETTKGAYVYCYDRYVRESFGKRKIATIKYSRVKEFYYGLIIEGGLSSATLDNVHTQIHPALQMAVRDGMLRLNPTDGVMAEIKKSHFWNVPKRHALTIPQQRAFTEFLRDNREFAGWVPVMIVLLGTGMRIGECLGLRWEDLDFENRIISVNHNLTDRPDVKGECRKRINTPKTVAGNRSIPMIDEVFEAFLQEYEMQKCMGYKSETIDGFTNFVFLTSGGSVVMPGSVDRTIHLIIKAYNDRETANAKKEKRDPVLLPSFSAHNLRHTFCTRLCENESNIKVIQEVMGHKDINTTMDRYAEATNEKKQEILANLKGKIIV